ncbi:MAG: XdhC family protein [Halanaerobium sp.]|nr:XdhC family protein [Halanaerobium sp.]
MDKRLLDELLQEGNSGAVALATIISSRGSSPRKPGTQMLVYPDGKISGTIGGGATEAAVIAEAKRMLPAGGVKKLKYEMTNSQAAQEGAICGGEVEIFLEVVNNR